MAYDRPNKPDAHRVNGRIGRNQDRSQGEFRPAKMSEKRVFWTVLGVKNINKPDAHSEYGQKDGSDTSSYYYNLVKKEGGVYYRGIRPIRLIRPDRSVQPVQLACLFSQGSARGTMQ